MFGYVKVYREELLVREESAYKAVYCSLCKVMGKEYSIFSRFILSYDCTFYALFLMATENSCTGFKDGRCSCNPLKKCKFCLGDNESLKKASALSVILAYFKLVDDINDKDDNFFKLCLKKIIKPVFSHWRKKAALKYSDIDKFASEMMIQQQKAENNQLCCLDEAADPTAQMLGKTLAFNASDDVQNRVFYQIGYQLGRWIYLVDALDDLKKDKISKSFNPFLLNANSTCNIGSFNIVLNQCLARIFDSYNLLNIKDFKGIIDNIILKGLPVVQKNVLDNLGGVNNERPL